MTNERAIELLNRISDSQFDGIHGDERREALEMAVRALEQNLVQESGSLVQDLVKDCISRQATMTVIENSGLDDDSKDTVVRVLEQLPSAKPERDIPVKPIETTDKAWGIPKRQAVCPKCDYYLGHVAFLGDYKGKRMTYCETCGQAIDWEGWDFDG